MFSVTNIFSIILYRIISISTQVLNVADFQVAVSVSVLTSKLQEIVTFLETQLSATIFVDTLG